MSEAVKERIWFVRLDFRDDPSNEQCSVWCYIPIDSQGRFGKV